MPKLTARRVEAVKEKGRYHDGNNLALQVNANGSKSWLFLYRLRGRSRQMGLGPVDLVTLAEARDLAFVNRKLLKQGIDPIDHRHAQRQKQLGSMTFEECAEKYIASQEPKWRNPKAKPQWESSLEMYAFPIIGKLPVNMIDTPLVLRVLEPIWAKKPETASRVRSRIERILDWAKVQKMRDGENPARWQGNLKLALPGKSEVRAVNHFKAMPYEDVPAFMAALKLREGTAARALEFTVLTAARTNEVTGAKWSEIDLENRVWVVPGERMKNTRNSAPREHRVPLATGAVELLKKLPRDTEQDGYVFIGMRKNQPLSNMAMATVLKRMKRTDATVHGFRSSFKDWASETTNYPDIVSEMALAHTVPDATQAAYRRGDLFKKRERLMADWAKHCLTPQKVKRSGNVTAIRAVA